LLPCRTLRLSAIKSVADVRQFDCDDLAEIAAIMRRYEAAGIQLADAALVWLAKRENIRTVFTLDRRDFSIVRLKRNRARKLLPDAIEK
jgi:predicted nucleic acid-binding protein